MSRTKMIQRIEKLNLMLDGSKEERENALFLKEKLMKKYNIQEEEIGEYVPKQKELNLTELFENLNLFDE